MADNNNNNNSNQQEQPGLVGGHAQYVKGVTEVSNQLVPLLPTLV